MWIWRAIAVLSILCACEASGWCSNLDCDSGYFVDKVLCQCIPCPTGYYSTRPNSVTCEACPKGTTTYRTASSNKRDCRQPKQCKKQGLHRLRGQRICSHGTFSSTGGLIPSARKCESCPKGYFQPYVGQTCCYKCPFMTSTPGEGSLFKMQCESIFPERTTEEPVAVQCNCTEQRVQTVHLTEALSTFSVELDADQNCRKMENLLHCPAESPQAVVVLQNMLLGDNCSALTISNLVTRGPYKLKLPRVYYLDGSSAEGLKFTLDLGDVKKSLSLTVSFSCLNNTAMKWLKQSSILDDCRVRMGLRSRSFVRKLQDLTRVDRLSSDAMLCPFTEVLTGQRQAYTEGCSRMNHSNEHRSRCSHNETNCKYPWQQNWRQDNECD